MNRAPAAPGSTAVPAAAAVAPPSARPLTEAQAGLWYAQQLDPANPVFNTAHALEMRGPLDVEAFRRAVETTVREADALSIRVGHADDDGAPVQWVDPSVRPSLHVVDLSDLADPAAEAERRMKADIATPVDPQRDPITAERLFQLGERRYVWYQRVHHIAIDAYGTSLLMRRVCDLYSAAVEGGAPSPSPFAPYEALLDWEAEYLGSDRRARDREFWLERLGDAPPAATLAPGGQRSAHRYASVSLELDPAFLQRLTARSAAAGVVWPDALLVLVAAYLQRHTGEPAVTLGMPVMNRLGGVAARVPALTMNVLPARLSVDEEAPLVACWQAAAKQLAQARRHGRYRGEQLRRDLGLLGEEERLHGPLVNILPFEQPLHLPGVEVVHRVLATGPVDDLNVEFRGEAGGGAMRLELQAHPDRYPEDLLRAHLERLRAFLVTAMDADSLAAVPTLTADETRHWVEEVNRTEHPIPAGTLTDLVEERLRANAELDALSFRGHTLTADQVDAATAALAHDLVERGVRPGSVVAVALPRSHELIVALLAILRAGGAYLPLDPEHPPERLARTLEQARAALVITSSAVRPSLPHDAAAILLDAVPAADAGAPDRLRRRRVDPGPHDPAYVIYTSGSTGTPKGVVVEHRSIVNRLEWMRSAYSVDSRDRIVQKTPATFDVSVWEFFLPFLSGAALVVAPPGVHRDPAALAKLLREERITVAHFVPSMLTLFLEEPSVGEGLSLSRVFCSGEALGAPLRDRFHRTIDAELHNLYGPTEAAVDVSYWEAGPRDRSDPVPIGRPVWNTRLYVLDERLRPLPPGVAGQLYIGGVQVARGYLHRPDLTAERFIPDPFVGGDGRMYSTGDLAMWRPDGAIAFLGRSDFQVKIRGQRVELGEIEAVLQSHEGVARAVAVAREDRPGDQRLVAYVVPADPAMPPPAAELHEYAARWLPDAWIPSSFVPLAALPLTSSGKLDRAALPAPVWDGSRDEGRGGRPPAGATERRLAALFADLLGVERVLADDDFFRLGGHSLTAARLAGRIRDGWGIEIGLAAVFAHPTVARLAMLLDGAEGEVAPEAEGLGPLIRLGDAGDSATPLFLVHPAGGIAWCYRSLAERLSPDVRVHGLQARGLDPAAPLPATLDEMAADYVEQVRRVQPTGPVHLGGWSVGGIIAHAMAVQLERAGVEVGVLAMLDAYPSDRWRNLPDADDTAALKALLQIAGRDPDSIPERSLTREAVIGMLREGDHPLGRLSARALEGVARVVETNNRLVRAHHHQRFGGHLVHFRAALDHQDEDLHPQQWAAYVGSLEVHDLECLHPHMILPRPSEVVARVLDHHLNGRAV